MDREHGQGKDSIADQVSIASQSEEVEQKLIEQAGILNNVSDAVIAYDIAFRVTYWNPSAERIYGYTAAEAMGKVSNELLKPVYPGISRQQLVEQLKKDGHLEVESSRIAKGGRPVQVETHVIALRDESGKIKGYAVVDRDITERKNIVDALKRSEEKYRNLFDTMSEGFALHEIILDSCGEPCDYRFLDVNNAFANLTGLSRDKIMGKRVKEVLPGIEQYWITSYGRVALTGKPAIFENFAAPLGKWYGIYAYSPVKNQFAVLFRDITESRQTEEELEQHRSRLAELVEERTEELIQANKELQNEIADRIKAEKAVEAERRRFSDVLNMLPAYLILLAVDYHVPFANRFFEERFGESLGQRCFEYLFHRTEPCENCETYTVLKTGYPHHWEWLGPDGHYYDIHDFPFTDADGSNLIMEMGVDITEQKKAQQALVKIHDELELRVQERTRELAETRDYLDNLFNYANAPIIVWNPGFEITRFNHAFERLTGHSANEVLGQKLDILFPEQSRKTSMDRIRQTVVGERWETVEIPILRRDGAVRLVLWNSATLCAPDGKTAVATIAQGQDITDRKAAEEELRRRTSELEVSNKELEAFSYSVSHDLRAPLRIMEGFSDALLDDYADKLDDQGRQYLRHIQDSSDLMAHLIDDLLKLSRVTRSDMNREWVDLSEMARKIASDLSHSEPQHSIRVEIAADLAVFGDRNLLRLVVENLLSNAWKFSSKVAEPRIEMGVVLHKGRQAYFIRDNGVGFDMQYYGNLFKPFQRLHKASDFAGTGIGLATVQRIIHRHGGVVWAESKVGEGATFYFTLE
jgi:PAS domain S-box-containing protein